MSEIPKETRLSSKKLLRGFVEEMGKQVAFVTDMSRNAKNPVVTALVRQLPKELERFKHESNRLIGKFKKGGTPPSPEYWQGYNIALARLKHVENTILRELGLEPIRDEAEHE